MAALKRETFMAARVAACIMVMIVVQVHGKHKSQKYGYLNNGLKGESANRCYVATKLDTAWAPTSYTHHAVT